MPRCGNCGKANREGAVFCQDCGHRIDRDARSGAASDGAPGTAPAPAAAANGATPVSLINSAATPGSQGQRRAAPPQIPPPAAAPQPAPPAAAPDGPTCPSCGTVNPATMNFCKMCGTALGAQRAAATGGPAPGRVACVQCGKQTPAGFAFCQHCGHRLQASADQRAGEITVAAPAPVQQPLQVAPQGPPPSAGVIAPGYPARPGRVEGPVMMSSSPSPTPPAGMRAVPLQPQPPIASQPQPQRAAVANAAAGPGAPVGSYAQAPAAHGVPLAPSRGQALFGRLIVVRRDGSDGDVIPLSGETFDIGRQEGSLCFAEDPFLATRHARFLVYGGVVRVRPLDTVNGVLIRLRDPHELQSGDVFYIGKELVRFESLSPEERDPPSLVEHGVRLFGSAPREAWGRLRQLTGAGTTRDMWYLSRPDVVLGREEGDITFPDDEFMSRRHAVLSRAGNRARLIDQNSSNGTYLRLRGDRELRPSDVLRMGDQLLRFEP